MTPEPGDHTPGPMSPEATARILALYDQLTAEQRDIDDAAFKALLEDAAPDE